MKHLKTGKSRTEFALLASTRSAQAAMMTLQPGGSTGEHVENEHPNAEQWLFVVSGTGKATVGRRSVKLAANSLLLIEKGEPHRIVNTGRSPLVTLNFYVPPAYKQGGDVKLSVTNANLLRTIARPFTPSAK
jgi:mannose-6-phosphate isomerase-like protein (cupin superfamily)